MKPIQPDHKPEAKAAAPKEATPKASTPEEQLVSALQAFMNAGTGKISPGNAVWNQANSALRNVPKKS